MSGIQPNMVALAIPGQEYTEVFRNIPMKIRVAYGLGHVLNDICASMWFTYLLVYLHLVLEIENWEAGALLLIGQVVDAIATPLIGYASDRSEGSWMCKYGKRKTWHLIGCVLVMISFPCIFIQSPYIGLISNGWRMFYYSGFITLFQFGWASVQISHLSLIPELTPNENDRVNLISIRYAFTVMSNVMVYLITWNMLRTRDTPLNPSDASKFETVVWLGLGVGIWATLMFHCTIHEKRNEFGGNNVRGAQLRLNTWEIFTNYQLYQVALIYMATRLFVNLSQVFIPLYLHETLGMSANTLAKVPLVMYLGSLISSAFAERINKIIGREGAYLGGATCALFGVMVMKVVEQETIVDYGIFVVALFFGIGGSIILITSLGITCDLIGDSTGSGALIYGLMSFSDKLSSGIAVIAIQDLHTFYESTIYYENAVFYVCGGVLILGSLIASTLFIRPITRASPHVMHYPSVESVESSVIYEINRPTI